VFERCAWSRIIKLGGFVLLYYFVLEAIYLSRDTACSLVYDFVLHNNYRLCVPSLDIQLCVKLFTNDATFVISSFMLLSEFTFLEEKANASS
jgi:hypothetical protein